MRGSSKRELGAKRLSADQKAELVRLGALELGRRFVGKFAARFEGEGLAPRAAAEEAIVDLARDGLRAVLGLVTPAAARPRARRLAPAAASPRTAEKPRPSPRRRARAAPPAAVPDPLARLKRSIVPDGTG